MGADRHTGGVVGRVRQVPGLYRDAPPVPADYARGGCRLGGDRGRDRAGRRTPRRRARSPGRARQRSPTSHLRHRHDDRARPRGAAVVLSLDGGGRSLLAGPGPAGRVVGSSLTRKTLYRGGILGDSLGSRVHLPLSVKRLGKNGRNIGLAEIGHTVIVMTDWFPSAI